MFQVGGVFVDSHDGKYLTRSHPKYIVTNVRYENIYGQDHGSLSMSYQRCLIHYAKKLLDNGDYDDSVQEKQFYPKSSIRVIEHRKLTFV